MQARQVLRKSRQMIVCSCMHFNHDEHLSCQGRHIVKCSHVFGAEGQAARKGNMPTWGELLLLRTLSRTAVPRPKVRPTTRLAPNTYRNLAKIANTVVLCSSMSLPSACTSTQPGCAEPLEHASNALKPEHRRFSKYSLSGNMSDTVVQCHAHKMQRLHAGTTCRDGESGSFCDAACCAVLCPAVHAVLCCAALCHAVER